MNIPREPHLKFAYLNCVDWLSNTKLDPKHPLYETLKGCKRDTLVIMRRIREQY